MKHPNLTAASNTTSAGINLELKIPPVVIWFVIAVLMWLTAFVSVPFDFIFRATLSAACILGLLGLAIGGAGVISFQHAKTTVNPTRPGAASALVVSGIYRFTRNPMYLGLLLVLLGWGVFLSNALALIWITAFVVYLNRFQICPEERALSRLFPHDFPTYRAKVRRWI